ncbi:MAG: 3-hydroxyacyl-CoA dehydrogenase NAD-binding domain-containing protein [Pseudomonadota bacterium]
MTASKPVETVAMIGLGSVGSGWAALLLARGVAVKGFDPGGGAADQSRMLIGQSWPSLIELGIASDPEPPFEKMTVCDTIVEAVTGADIIIENVPENLELKHNVMTQIDGAAANDALILSSAGGIAATELQSVCQHPERVIVMHPFNPSHLIPLVEIAPGQQTSQDTVDRTLALARFIGKEPIVVSGERPGHMVNRLQFALVREAIRCLADGVATPQDIDDAVRFGLAPRWVFQGGLQTLAMAGGPGGMKGILDHAGPAMQKWWATEEDYKLTDEIKAQLVDAAEQYAAGAEFSEWVAWRDRQLVNLLRLQSDADAQRPENMGGQDT